MTLSQRWYAVRYWWIERFGRTYITTHSKTPTKRTGYFDAMGIRERAIMSLDEKGGLDYTLEEYSKMVVACASCGKPIWPLSAVNLVIPVGPILPGTHFVPEENAYLSCARGPCYIDFMQGFWQPDGANPFRCHFVRSAVPMVWCSR